MRAFLQKLRKYEIRIRKAVNTQMHGQYNSVFKGAGLEFDDIRSYQYGDDVRTIDWNVTAKGHGTFVKTFREEKEQTIFFMLDVSASQQIGSPDNQKIDIAKEICGVLALAAIKEGSQVGLYCFSDDKERYLKPEKGLTYAYTIIKNLFNLEVSSLKTSIVKASFFALNILKRRSVIILISDFIDTGYQQSLKALARRHDLILIKVFDNREIAFPAVGIIPVTDRELNKTVWVNTSSAAFRRQITGVYHAQKQDLETFSKQNQVNLVSIETGEDYVPTLVRLFKTRNKTFKSGK